MWANVVDVSLCSLAMEIKNAFSVSCPEFTQHDVAARLQVTPPHVPIATEGAEPLVLFDKPQVTVFGESNQAHCTFRRVPCDALSLLEFRSQRDIDISLEMYKFHPKLGDESAGEPAHSQSREIDMTNDANLFCDDPSGLPVYEGRMIDQYDHRAKGYVSGRARAANWQELQFGSPTKRIVPQGRI